MSQPNPARQSVDEMRKKYPRLTEAVAFLAQLVVIVMGLTEALCVVLAWVQLASDDTDYGKVAAALAVAVLVGISRKLSMLSARMNSIADVAERGEMVRVEIVSQPHINGGMNAPLS